MELLVAFVGGLSAVALKGWVDLWFERRRKRGAIRAAARLVDEQFSSMCIYTATVLDAGQWIPTAEFTFDHGAWLENKHLLALALDDNSWEIVSIGYRAVWTVENDRRDAVGDSTEGVAPVENTQLLQMAAADIERAEGVLMQVATSVLVPLHRRFLHALPWPRAG